MKALRILKCLQFSFNLFFSVITIGLFFYFIVFPLSHNSQAKINNEGRRKWHCYKCDTNSFLITHNNKYSPTTTIHIRFAMPSHLSNDDSTNNENRLINIDRW